MSTDRTGTLRDPNSFNDHDYHLKITYSLDYKDKQHHHPPVTCYTWEDFEEKLDILEEYFGEDVDFEKREVYMDTDTLEEVFRCIIVNGIVGSKCPFYARNHFDVLNKKTLDDLKSIVKYME